MTDIGVYTDPDTLIEKIEFAEDPVDTWWELAREPKTLPEKIFFASECKWQGFFTIERISTFSGSMLIFLDKWHEIDKKTERSPFQGFTYRTPEVV